MKFNKIFAIVTIIVLLCGTWLYFLSSGVATEFQQLFHGFDINPPDISKLLFASLDYWWLIWGAIILLSYFPLFILKGKWQYTAILISGFSLVLLLGVVYLPIFNMGAVV